MGHKETMPPAVHSERKFLTKKKSGNKPRKGNSDSAFLLEAMGASLDNRGATSRTCYCIRYLTDSPIFTAITGMNPTEAGEQNHQNSELADRVGIQTQGHLISTLCSVYQTVVDWTGHQPSPPWSSKAAAVPDPRLETQFQLPHLLITLGGASWGGPWLC